MTAGQASFTLLDGPLLPNDAIEAARAIGVGAPGDLVADGAGNLLVADGNAIVAIGEDGRPGPVPLARFDGRVAALCRLRDGSIGAAVEGRGLCSVPLDGAPARLVSGADLVVDGVTAIAAAADGSVLAARGTTRPGIYPYTHELFAAAGSGLIVRAGADGACTVVAERLRGPHGVAVTPSGDVLVAETWEAAITMIRPSGGRTPVTTGFAAYPGRITPAADGGYLLACLSRRDPLVDFVRSEAAFAQRMMRELDPAHWIAPRLQSHPDVSVPAQASATRVFGKVKPWAASLSYGLVCEMSATLVPRASHHSRTDGRRHGIVSAVEWRGGIAALSLATREIVFLERKIRDDDRPAAA